MKRYEVLASEIANSIRTGVLCAGDRLPSVRHTSTSRQVSPSTVFKAYYLLEAQGLIRARERSGYYVTPSVRQFPPELDNPSHPQDGAVVLDISERVFDVFQSTLSREAVPLGSAFPSPVLFPMERLGHIMAACVQKMDPWSAVDDVTPGNADLRRQIALRYLNEGLHVHTDEIVITNGALEALNLCLAAVTRPGDTVVVESPSFYPALQALERLGLEAIEVQTHPREGIDLNALENALTRHRPKACWLMTNFQNPLGCLMPNEKKKALVELLTRHDVPLIEDDVYGELYYGEKRPISAKAFDTAGLVMHCSSFSKCLAPGYRIGWTAPGRFVKAVARHKLTTTLSTSAPTQLTLAAYLAKGGYDKHLRKLRHTLASQQTVFTQALGHYFPEGTRATRPSGGYCLWVELPKSANALEIHRQALSLGISVAPGPIFSAKRDFTNCLRLNYGHVWDNRTEQALATLGRLAKSHTGIHN
ncbi:MAG TPA: PLP-dependent aminotransferase family protein [Eoetvoesiella sp.]